MLPAMGKLRVDVWSDIACPWCWVGRRHLQGALAQFNQENDQEVEVVWHSFQLDRAAPRTHDPSVDLVQRLADKYGTGRAGAEAMIDRMDRVGSEAGLDFRFDRVQPTNTFDAHRLLHFAAKHGKQDELKEALFVAYMNEGRSVADHGVLSDVADAVGLPADETAAMLGGDDYAREVREDQGVAAQLGVTGVPFFAVDERYAIPGAQPSTVLLSALQRALADRAQPDDEAAPTPAASAADADPDAACGPDGCSVPPAG